MVNDSGQLYTIEGLAAGALMIVTAYLVMNATTVLTPGDIHVNDMQLAQLGNDVLKMMDTPDANNVNNVADWIKNNDPDSFKNEFLYYWPDRAPGMPDSIKFIATVHYNTVSGPGEYQFCEYPSGTKYLRENAVVASRWVTIDIPGPTHPNLEPRVQTVLLEVLLWRD